MGDHIHFSKRKIENPPIINTIMSMFDHKIRNDHKSIGWLQSFHQWPLWKLGK